MKNFLDKFDFEYIKNTAKEIILKLDLETIKNLKEYYREGTEFYKIIQEILSENNKLYSLTTKEDIYTLNENGDNYKTIEVTNFYYLDDIVCMDNECMDYLGYILETRFMEIL